MAQIINFNQANLKVNQRYLIDNNVLMYVFGDYNHNQYGYDNVWERLTESGAKLFVTPQIISEYINRNCRLAYDDYLKRHHLQRRFYSYKKDFRNSEQFQTVYPSIINTMKYDILNSCTIMMPKVESVKNALIADHNIDFNDGLFINTALENQLIIVTHDRDYFKVPKQITIYTTQHI